MNEYYVDCTWMMYAQRKITANSAEDAIKTACNLPLAEDAIYLEDSFQAEVSVVEVSEED